MAFDFKKEYKESIFMIMLLDTKILRKLGVKCRG